MKKQLLAVCICFLFGTEAFADIMGPPTAGVKKGQWSAGAEYFFTETNIEIKDSSLIDFFGKRSVTFKGWESNRMYFVLGYGLSDDWEVFVRLGSSDARLNDAEFRGAFEIAGGIGAKYTFIEDQTLPWGAVFQISWHSTEDSSVTVGEPAIDTITGKADVEWNEIKFAVGPTYNYSENLRFYGGLGLFLFDGEIKATDGIDKISVNAENESSFAGYIGAQLDLDKTNFINIEGQFTDNAWGIGAAIIWKL